MPSKTIVAEICLTIIICVAMWQGVNGAIISTGVVGIIGLGGYALTKTSATKGK